ncbi:cysteine dioxygenase family protein, partial [Burkholderia pseudomallei]
RHPAFARALRAALAEAAAAPGLLTPAQRESGAAGYRRHLLAADPAGRYAVVSLVWEPGQWSPVHGHHAWCGYAVLEGKLTEIVYRWSDAACCAIDARRRARPMGAVSYVCAGRDAIHRLGHAGAKTDAPAISLHVYGVAGEQVATHVNDVVAVDARAYA